MQGANCAVKLGSDTTKASANVVSSARAVATRPVTLVLKDSKPLVVANLERFDLEVLLYDAFGQALNGVDRQLNFTSQGDGNIAISLPRLLVSGACWWGRPEAACAGVGDGWQGRERTAQLAARAMAMCARHACRQGIHKAVLIADRCRGWPCAGGCQGLPLCRRHCLRQHRRPQGADRGHHQQRALAHHARRHHHQVSRHLCWHAALHSMWEDQPRCCSAAQACLAEAQAQAQSEDPRFPMLCQPTTSKDTWP